MPIYELSVQGDKSVRVEADSIEEARAKVKADIKAINMGNAARLAALPALEDILFDSERGVENMRLRTSLATADNFAERQNRAENILGEGGFTTTSDGKLAATPEGLHRLGLDVDYITLSDGTEIGKNVVIDGRTFGLNKYDLADFSDIAGPIGGALLFLTPQFKILQVISKFARLFGGKERFTRLLASSLGSGAGKGVEEFVEAQKGIQLNDDEEIRSLVVREGLYGAIGQGLAEGLGIGYQLLLGKNKPYDNVRFFRQAAQGRSLVDIMALDRKLGREATEKEIVKAIKDGTVTRYTEKGVVSQSNLGRNLAGRAQALSEQALGNLRIEGNKKFLFRDITNLFAKLNKESLEETDLQKLVQSYRDRTVMTPEQKIRIDSLIKDKENALQAAEGETLQSVKKLVDDLLEDVSGMGLYTHRVNKSELGNIIRENLSKARQGVDNNMHKKYIKVDQALLNLSNTRSYATILEKIVKPKADELKQIIKKSENSVFGGKGGLQIGDSFFNKGNATKYLTEIHSDLNNRLNKTIRAAREGPEALQGLDDSEIFNFKKLRDTISELKEQNSLFFKKSTDSKLVEDALEVLDTGIARGQRTGIFQEMENLDRGINGAKIAPDITDVATRKSIVQAARSLRSANEYAKKVLEPFDSEVVTASMVNNAKVGAYDIDQIYKKLVKTGESNDLRDTFLALRNYDKYVKKMKDSGKFTPGMSSDTELLVRNELKKKFISDAFYEALDPATNSIDFARFTTAFRQFERSNPNKLRILFGDEAGMTTDNFLFSLNQINKLKPNIKPDELRNLIKGFRASTDQGLAKTNVGRSFIEGLEELAEKKSKLAEFQGNRVVANLPDATTEEVVSKIFTPQGAKNIKIVKETLGEEAFKEIQNNAMNRVLQRAIDFDGLTKKGDIAKIFNPDKFNNILRSYGDEALEEMFGAEVAQGLKDYGRSIELMTAKEVGRGGAPGTLIAAAIAINAFNPALWPTVAGLAILRSAFANPTILKIMARTDKSAVVQLLEFFQRGLLLQGVRLAGEGLDQGTSLAEGEIERLTEEATDEDQSDILDIILNRGRDLVDDVADKTQQVRQPPISQISLPVISPVSIPNTDLQSTVEREEQLGFGRILT